MKAMPHLSQQRYPPFRVGLLILLLMAAYALSFVDRQVIALVVEPATTTMQLSDTELGILQGVAFAVLFIGFAPSLGRLADRANGGQSHENLAVSHLAGRVRRMRTTKLRYKRIQRFRIRGVER